MKMHCRTCGCHFDDDFEETLTEECNLWVEKGFSNDMSVKHKKALFDAFFSLPVDEIADETGVITSIQLSGTKGMVYTGNQFEEYVPGYKYMEDAKRRQFQKDYFKFHYNQDPKGRMMRDLMGMGILKTLKDFESKMQALDVKEDELSASAE